MNVRKKLKRLIAIMVCAVMVLGCTIMANAAYPNPYPEQANMHGPNAGNCTYRAWQEAYERLGVQMPKWGDAKDWYTGAKNSGQYEVIPWVPGNYVPSNSIAVWGASVGEGFGHVAFVASADENGFTLIEGNFSPTGPEGPYYSRWEQYWEYHSRSAGLLGFIVLQEEQTPNEPLTNSWTQELNISDWTYGESPSVPTAISKYGTPSFTYSTERDGTYTNEVPKNAGTYYVKATVDESDQYTGLEAIEEFQINKAVPEYEIPTGLTYIYGQTLNFNTLPAWLNWQDGTQAVGNVGQKAFLAYYNNYDPNYETIDNIEIIVTVLPFDLTGIFSKVKIDEDTDLDEIKFTVGTEVLVQGKDYKYTIKTNGDQVTVAFEGLGNFTGYKEIIYTLSGNGGGMGNMADDNESDIGETSNNSGIEEMNISENDVNGSGIPKTGDNSIPAVWVAMLVLAGGAVAVTAGKRKFNR